MLWGILQPFYPPPPEAQDFLEFWASPLAALIQDEV
jgi:hypothetical protein